MPDEYAQKKILKYLTVILALLAIAMLVREIFFSQGEAAPIDIGISQPRVDIDFSVLENSNVQGLLTVEQIEVPDLGRTNPFEPY